MLKEDLKIGSMENGKGFQFNGQWENFQFTVSTQLALGNQLQQHTRHQRGWLQAMDQNPNFQSRELSMAMIPETLNVT